MASFIVMFIALTEDMTGGVVSTGGGVELVWNV